MPIRYNLLQIASKKNIYILLINMRINSIKYHTLTLFTLCSMGLVANKVKAQVPAKQDTVKYHIPVDKYTSKDLPVIFRDTVNHSSWTNDSILLSKAPSPKFNLRGIETVAKGVVDITSCKLYIYDSNGKAVEAFNVANGASSSPTEPGVRTVVTKMAYPYSNSPASTKRYRFPADYGPKIAYLNLVDTITGVLSDNGQYLHGTKNDQVLLRPDRHFTHGCTRLPNRDALYVINDVLKIGDYLKFVK